MSTGAEGVFKPVLQEVGRGLGMPLPTQTRILMELEADLQALTARFVAQGLDAGEARRRAEEALVPDAPVVFALGRIHETPYRRLTRRFPAERLLRFERQVLLGSTGALLLVLGALLATTDLLAYASPFLWPVLALGALGAALTMWKAFELWIKRDHSGMNRGLDGLLGLSVATIIFGCSGAAIDLSRLAGILETSPELIDSILLFWLVRDAGLLAVSLLLALAGGLAWFVFRQWTVHVEAAHRELVGSPTPRTKE